jgi:hypothetical protein
MLQLQEGLELRKPQLLLLQQIVDSRSYHGVEVQLDLQKHSTGYTMEQSGFERIPQLGMLPSLGDI